MRLREDIDVNAVNWHAIAAQASHYAEGLPPGLKRSAEMDYAQACEALAQSRDALRASFDRSR